MDTSYDISSHLKAKQKVPQPSKNFFSHKVGLSVQSVHCCASWVELTFTAFSKVVKGLGTI